MILDHVLVVLYLAVATAGLAVFVRAWPWPASLLKRKPLACPMCMTGWSGFAVIGYASWSEYLRWDFIDLPLLWLALVGLAAPVFKALYPPDIDLPMP